jgi:hypothetical protein
MTKVESSMTKEIPNAQMIRQAPEADFTSAV